MGSTEEIRADDLFQLVQNIAKTIPTIYIRGNHDSRAEDLGMENVVLVDKLELCEGAEGEPKCKILILHGHQLYFSLDAGRLSRWASWLNQIIFRWFGWNLQAFVNSGWLYNLNIRRRRRSLARAFGEGQDVIIMAHTHQPGYFKDFATGVEVYDVGSCWLSNSWLFLEGNKIWIEICNNYPQTISSLPNPSNPS